jgi:hypothetical protein
MRALILFACAALSAAALTGSAVAADPAPGVLSVERGRGTVSIDIRGSVLGRLANGSLRVTDLTPRDRFAPSVVGRKLTVTRLGPRTLVYRGQGLRFRMLGGGYRMSARGSGISVSAVGLGSVVLDADARYPGDDVGVFSLEDGVECGMTPEACRPLPSEPERFVLGPAEDESQKALR